MSFLALSGPAAVELARIDSRRLANSRTFSGWSFDRSCASARSSARLNRYGPSAGFDLERGRCRNQFPGSAANRQTSRKTSRMMHEFAANGFSRCAQKDRQLVHAVPRRLRRKRPAQKVCACRQKIDMADQLIGHAGRNVPLPPRDEGNAMSPLEKPAFVPSQGAVAAVAARIMARTVLVSVIHHAAVVARDNDECVIGELESVQGGKHFAHRPVELLDDVSPRAMSGSCRRIVGSARGGHECRAWRSREKTDAAAIFR